MADRVNKRKLNSWPK